MFIMVWIFVPSVEHDGILGGGFVLFGIIGFGGCGLGGVCWREGRNSMCGCHSVFLMVWVNICIWCRILQW